jgi:Mrp family chromosome partitioning ATPase
MKNTLEIKKVTDVVVIDTSPVFAVADAALLASEMDGVLLVVRPGVTTFSTAK